MQSNSRNRTTGRGRVGTVPAPGRVGLRRLLAFGAGGAVTLGLLYAFIAAPSFDPAREWARERVVNLAAFAGFRLDKLYVEGREYTDAEVLRGLLNMKRGDPLFAFDPDTARDLLMRVSWVRDANVRRELPGTIYISLDERQPLALWQHDGAVRVIDGDGVVLTTDIRAFSKLPLVVGQGANREAVEILGLINAEPALAARVEAATWIGERRWDLALRGGMTVKLPEENVGLAVQKLADAQARDSILDKDLTQIDLREPDRLVVRTRMGGPLEQPVNFNGPSAGKDL